MSEDRVTRRPFAEPDFAALAEGARLRAGLHRNPTDRQGRSVSYAAVQYCPVPDRSLVSFGPEHECWRSGECVFDAGAIVWLKPPPGCHPDRVANVAGVLREQGCVVKLLPPDRIDDVVAEVRAEPAPERDAQDAREVVYQLCRELAPRAGVDPDDAVREAETYLAAAGL